MLDESHKLVREVKQDYGQWDQISLAVVLTFLDEMHEHILAALATYATIPYDELPDSMKNNLDYWRNCESCICWLKAQANLKKS